MPELNVTKVSIKTLLSGKQNGKQFIIPDYQRPYAWDQEKCDTLWSDLVNFHEGNDGGDYFLGTIVTCGSDNPGNIDVIDGQQRIISLFLLLRAFYWQLESMPSDDAAVQGLQNQLAPCLWDVDEISLKVEDKTKIHIQSKVATEKGDASLKRILETGESGIDQTEEISESVIKKQNDKYLTNYLFFLKQCKEYAGGSPLQWKPLIVAILNRCIVLPIECDSLETGLTIFSTLNDRGLPLSDADIFKAQIYKTKANDTDKKAFADAWKNLFEKSENAKLRIDDLFRYYTHIIRAKKGDSSREISLRRFYSKNKYESLRGNPDELMNDLSMLCEFWSAVHNREPDVEIEGKKYHLSLDAHKYFHCLQRYPNEYWKYLTSVFFYVNHKSKTFEQDLLRFLKQITAFLFVKYIQNPTVNAIKDNTFRACINIQGKSEALFPKIKDIPKGDDISKEVPSKLARPLLLLYAYQNKKQKSLIPINFEIEHIFPKKWQNTNYNGWKRKDADEYLEKFGNKVVITRKINTQAGNKYFGNKKKKYAGSDIAEVKKLSECPKDDFLKDDIKKREIKFVDVIHSFFVEALKS